MRGFLKSHCQLRDSHSEQSGDFFQSGRWNDSIDRMIFFLSFFFLISGTLFFPSFLFYLTFSLSLFLSLFLIRFRAAFRRVGKFSRTRYISKVRGLWHRGKYHNSVSFGNYTDVDGIDLQRHKTALSRIKFPCYMRCRKRKLPRRRPDFPPLRSLRAGVKGKRGGACVFH